MASCLHKKIPKKIILLRMDYDKALKLEKNKAERTKRFHSNTLRFSFFRMSFRRNYAKIIPNLYDTCCTLSAFCLRNVSTLIPKQLSAKRCSNFVVLFCTAEIERVQILMRTLGRTDFKST